MRTCRLRSEAGAGHRWSRKASPPATAAAPAGYSHGSDSGARRLSLWRTVAGWCATVPVPLLRVSHSSPPHGAATTAALTKIRDATCYHEQAVWSCIQPRDAGWRDVRPLQAVASFDDGRERVTAVGNQGSSKMGVNRGPRIAS